MALISSVVVKDLRLKDEDKDKDLKFDPRGSFRTRTFLEDNNTAVRQYGEIDMNLNLTGAQWQIKHPFVTQSLQDDGASYFACYTLAYSILEKFRGLELPRTRIRT